jgi:hypothetical protein
MINHNSLDKGLGFSDFVVAKNHIQIVYVPNRKRALRACRIKAPMLAAPGIEVHLCGQVDLT